MVRPPIGHPCDGTPRRIRAGNRKASSLPWWQRSANVRRNTTILSRSETSTGSPTLKLLCQDRHAGHHLLDNSMFRLQHLYRHCPAHLISLTIVSRSSLSSSAWMSCGMALSNAITVPAASVRGSPATPNWTAPESTCSVIGPSTSCPHRVAPFLMAVKTMLRLEVFTTVTELRVPEIHSGSCFSKLISSAIANVIAGPQRTRSSRGAVRSGSAMVCSFSKESCVGRSFHVLLPFDLMLKQLAACC